MKTFSKLILYDLYYINYIVLYYIIYQLFYCKKKNYQTLIVEIY